MSNNPDPQSRPPLQWSDADDRAMDALLREYFRNQDAVPQGDKLDSRKSLVAGPRDFTSDILAQWDQSRSHSAGSRTRKSTLATTKTLAPSRESNGISVAVRWFVVLAASVLAVIAIRGWKENANQRELALHAINKQDGGGPATDQAGNLAAVGDASPPGADGANSGGATQPQVTAKPRRDPIVLSLDKPVDGGDDAPRIAGGAAGVIPTGQPSAIPLRGAAAVLFQNANLQDFDRQFLAYWKSIGVTPAPAVDNATLANRIADRFGFRPGTSTESESSIDNSGVVPGDRVMTELASNDLFSTERQSRLLAERLVKQLGSGLKLADARNEQLVASAAEVIRSGGRFDRWISDWVASEAIPSEPAGAAHLQAAAMGEWVGGRLMGADVGCARCHDSPIDSRFNQHDYWAVAAIFTPSPTQSVFYEMPDGRQRVAAPGAPKRWLGLPREPVQPGVSDAAIIASRDGLAVSLVGNRQLARTLVNHLWTIGFGAPMVSAASSPIAPPQEDSIELALEMLSEKLLASDFDIRVAARWIIQSEPMKRGTPVQLQGDAWQLAGESQLVAASLAQRSFAAARSPWPAASRAQLLALMESRSGKQPAKIGTRDSMLAQPFATPDVDSGKPTTGSRGGKAVNKPVDHQDYWWTQWLADREGLKGGWMESIADRDQQVRHAFYAAGYRNVNEQQLAWGNSLIDSSATTSNDPNEEIAKIYWVIQNSQ